jgi:hypothetical protein
MIGKSFKHGNVRKFNCENVEKKVKNFAALRLSDFALKGLIYVQTR